MLISYDKKFLFLRIPKTGGTSVNAALVAYRNPLERKFYARVIRRLPFVPTPYQFLPFDARPHWGMLKAKQIIPAQVLNNLFKFSFVRHPVHWQLSVFKHILRHEQTGDFAQHFSDVYRHRSFAEYIRWRIDSGVIPQVAHMIDENGELQLDFVGRFEFLERDFALVCQATAVPVPVLGHLNQGPHSQEVAVDSKSQQMIYDAYQIDFETFGYTESGPLPDWTFHKDGRSPAAAKILVLVNGADFDPWKANVYK
jgi:hypothetical protein